MEHVCPEDWPGILRGFRDALKPGGVLYFTLDLAEADEVEEAYERVKALGRSVVPGELADVAVYIIIRRWSRCGRGLDKRGWRSRRRERGNDIGIRFVIASRVAVRPNST